MATEESVLDIRPSENRKNTIVKSNTLIRGRQRLTLQERRIIYMFISKIKPTDTDFRIMRLKVSDIAKCLGLTSDNYYGVIKKLIIDLQKKGVYIKKEESTLYVNWLASSEYYNHQGIVEVEFSSKMKPYLLQLKKEYYTKFKLENVVNLNSVYSMQMYELLKQNYYRHAVQFTITDLRYMLDIKEDSYARVSQFKLRIIDQAKKEINSKTDINFSYTDIKQGRQIVAFLFKIEANKKYKDPENISLGNPDEDNENFEVYQKLLSYGITNKITKELLSSFSYKRVLTNVEYVLSKKKSYKNLAGAIVNAIRLDYAASDLPSLFDNEEKPKPNAPLTLEEVISEFIGVRESKENINDIVPEFMLESLFKKHITLFHSGNDFGDLTKVWEENKERIISEIKKWKYLVNGH